MEIQTFFLALEVQQRGPGSYVAVTPCVTHFSPPDGAFPFQVRLPYLLLLRRARKTTDDPVSLKFNLIDPDGQTTGEPANARATGTFPAGHMSMILAGHILFRFPTPGDYRLDITVNEDVSATLYSYDLEIGTGPGG